MRRVTGACVGPFRTSLSGSSAANSSPVGARLLRRAGRCAAGGILALALAGRAPAAEWDGYVSAATDYVYRGVSLLDSGPALQGGVEGHFGETFLFGATAANIDHQWLYQGSYQGKVSDHLELNFYTGVDLECGAKCRARVIVSSYVFPGAGTRDWQEATASIAFAERVGASFSWSPHGLGSGTSTRTAEAWFVQPFSRLTSVTVDAGNIWIGPHDYWFGRIGVSHRIDRWMLDLSEYISDPKFRRYGFDEHSQRLVLSVSTAF